MYYIDMHCDTITRLLKDADQGKSSNLRENDLHIDLNRMKQANYLLQNFAVFTPLGHVDELTNTMKKLTRTKISFVQCIVMMTLKRIVKMDL